MEEQPSKNCLRNLRNESVRKDNLPDIKMYYKASITKTGILLVYKLTDQWNRTKISRNRPVCGNLGKDKGVVLFKTTGGKMDFLISSIDIARQSYGKGKIYICFTQIISGLILNRSDTYVEK